MVMDADNTIEVTFIVGEWMPTEELIAMLEREQAEAESPEPSEPELENDEG
jgi:hypothetical protein